MNPLLFAAGAPTAVAHTAFGSQTALFGGLAALFVGLVLLLLVALTGVHGGVTRARVLRRMSIYTITGRRVSEDRRETTALGDNAVARSAVEFADRMISRGDLQTVLARKLEAAGVPLTPAEWLLLHLGLTVVIPLVLVIVSSGGALVVLLGLIIGLVAPWVFLTFKESRRVSRFLAQLPPTLQLMSGSLSAGYSLPQAVDTVVREGSQPIAGEFGKALVETRLGAPIEDALDGVATRMNSNDFKWTVMAIKIQREVGGNLAEVLSTVAATLRERERLRRQVQVLSAEGRLSAWILGSLPVLFGTYLVLVRPQYIRILYTDKLGIAMLIAAGMVFVTAVLIMRKMIRMEV